MPGMIPVCLLPRLEDEAHLFLDSSHPPESHHIKPSGQKEDLFPSSPA